MSQFHGPQPGYKGSHGRTKGIMLARREEKKLDAEYRDSMVPPDHPCRKSVRLGSLPEPDLTTKRKRNRRKNAARVPVVPAVEPELEETQALS